MKRRFNVGDDVVITYFIPKESNKPSVWAEQPRESRQEYLYGQVSSLESIPEFAPDENGDFIKKINPEYNPDREFCKVILEDGRTFSFRQSSPFIRHQRFYERAFNYLRSLRSSSLDKE